MSAISSIHCFVVIQTTKFLFATTVYPITMHFGSVKSISVKFEVITLMAQPPAADCWPEKQMNVLNVENQTSPAVAAYALDICNNTIPFIYPMPHNAKICSKLETKRIYKISACSNYLMLNDNISAI